MIQQRKAIGVLGGMGPEASEFLYKLLIEKAIKNYGAKHNDDFPEIVLHSIPVPDFISSDTEREKALLMLEDRVEKLQYLDLCCLSIACNTAHILIDKLQAKSQIPFISMIDAVADRIQAEQKKLIGVLGTPSTLRYKLYQNELEKRGVGVINPTEDQINQLEIIIRHVLAGTATKTDEEALKTIADTLSEQGAEGIILGCTELPLVFPKQYLLPVYSSLDILADALLTVYYA